MFASSASSRRSEYPGEPSSVSPPLVCRPSLRGVTRLGTPRVRNRGASMNKGLWSIVAVAAIALAWGHQAGVFAQKADIHDPAVAVANLDVHPELQATLFASEPQITNPTNLDIDHRGR